MSASEKFNLRRMESGAVAFAVRELDFLMIGAGGIGRVGDLRTFTVTVAVVSGKLGIV